MKLLFLAPYPPYPPHGGGQQRIYQFVRHAAREHEVWLLSFSSNAHASTALDPLRDLCHVVTIPTPVHAVGKRLRTLIGSTLPDMALRGRSTAFAHALDQLLADVPFDVVQAESIEMAQFGRQSPDRSAPLYVYDAFNAEFLLQRRAFLTDLRRIRKVPTALYSLIQWHKLWRYEAGLAQHFAGALAVSAQDAATLQRLAPTLPFAVVPNGVDTTFFMRDPSIAPDRHMPTILFTGTLDFRPNIDAVTWFVHEVLPRVRVAQPHARFAVVGRNPAPAVEALQTEPGVEIVGAVNDIRPWFGRASVYVVPMRIGGGVRLKMLEALAMEVPVVATHMGAEGIGGLGADNHAALADHPHAFADQIVRVLTDAAYAQALATAGRRLVVEQYDWRSIVPRMIDQWRVWKST